MKSRLLGVLTPHMLLCRYAPDRLWFLRDLKKGPREWLFSWRSENLPDENAAAFKLYSTCLKNFRNEQMGYVYPPKRLHSPEVLREWLKKDVWHPEKGCLCKMGQLGTFTALLTTHANKTRGHISFESLPSRSPQLYFLRSWMILSQHIWLQRMYSTLVGQRSCEKFGSTHATYEANGQRPMQCWWKRSS